MAKRKGKTKERATDKLNCHVANSELAKMRAFSEQSGISTTAVFRQAIDEYVKAQTAKKRSYPFDSGLSGNRPLQSSDERFANSKQSGNTLVSVYVTPTRHGQLQTIANGRSASVASVVRSATKAFILNHDGQVLQTAVKRASEPTGNLSENIKEIFRKAKEKGQSEEVKPAKTSSKKERRIATPRIDQSPKIGTY